MAKPFNAEEEDQIRAALDLGSSPRCPRCGSAMDVRPIQASPRVAYVRTRFQSTCNRCLLTAVVDVDPKVG